MNTVERVAEAIRRNPEGLLLLGAGVALMLRHAASSAGGAAERQSRASRASDRYDADGAGETSGGSAASELAGKVSAAAGDVRSYVAEAAQDLTDRASEYGQAASRRAREAADSAYRSAEGVFETHPMSIAVAGLAAGCLAAAVFPPTRFERDTLGPIGRRAADAAAETGELVKSAAVERVTSAALKAGGQLKDAVAEGRVNTGNIGEVARDIASDFKSNLTGGAGETGGRKADTPMAKAQL